MRRAAALAFDSVWPAVAGQAYRVVDADGRDVPDYVPGELLIGGDSLARGYRNDPELTAQRFVQQASGRWYRTGDRGRYWPTARSNSWGARIAR